VVDDDASVRAVVGRMLQLGGADVVRAAGGREAIEALRDSQFDVVLTDLRMPDLDGTQVLREARQMDLDVPVVVLTGIGDAAATIEALRLGACDCLAKPLEMVRIRNAVARAGKMGRLARAKRMAFEALGRLNGEAGDRTSLALALERALDSMWMAFQPVVRRDGSLFGYEALMRTGETSLPHPTAVLDAAERLDCVWDVGARAREVAAMRSGEVGPNLKLFLNVHADDLNDPAWLSADETFASLAHRTILEITEKEPLDRVKNPKRAIAQLRERGYGFAVDHLGAGHAGIEAISNVEPDVVKLDMSLIRDVDTDPRKARAIGEITELCHDLGMTVVAEGVERREERDRLLELGCDLFQGFLIARPDYPFPSSQWPPAASA